MPTGHGNFPPFIQSTAKALCHCVSAVKYIAAVHVANPQRPTNTINATIDGMSTLSSSTERQFLSIGHPSRRLNKQTEQPFPRHGLDSGCSPHSGRVALYCEDCLTRPASIKLTFRGIRLQDSGGGSRSGYRMTRHRTYGRSAFLAAMVLVAGDAQQRYLMRSDFPDLS